MQFPGLHLVVTLRTSSGDSRFKIRLSESYFNHSWPRMRGASAAAQCPLDGVLSQPTQQWAMRTPGLGNRPPAPRRPNPVRTPRFSRTPGARILTSPVGCRGLSDAMARGSEAAQPRKPEAALSAGRTGTDHSSSPLFILPKGRQEVRHRNAPRPHPASGGECCLWWGRWVKLTLNWCGQLLCTLLFAKAMGGTRNAGGPVPDEESTRGSGTWSGAGVR